MEAKREEEKEKGEDKKGREIKMKCEVANGQVGEKVV